MSQNKGQYEFDALTVEKTFESFYIVPDYQREYVWKADEHVAKLQTAAKQVAAKLGKKISDAQLKAIARAMSETDPTAEPVIKKTDKKSGVVTYEPDTDLRDTEKIAVSEDIQAYFDREVKPYVDDAWIDWDSIEIGCEISFNKYFYKPVALRSLEENEQDIIALDQESQGFIRDLLAAK